MKPNQAIKVYARGGAILLTAILQGNCGTVIMERSESGAISRGAAMPFRAYAQGNGFCIAVNYNGRILSSSDEISWSDINEVNDSVRLFFRAAAYGNDTFVVVGGSYVGAPNAIVTLKRRKVWTFSDSGTRDTLFGVAFGAGRFVAVGDHGAILTSKDGICWRKRNSGTSDTLFASVAFGDNIFVAVGDTGTIVTSHDGVKWQAHLSGTCSYLNKVSYDAGAFWATGTGGLVLVSTDGIEWISRPPPLTAPVIGALDQQMKSGVQQTSKTRP